MRDGAFAQVREPPRLSPASRRVVQRETRILFRPPRLTWHREARARPRRLDADRARQAVRDRPRTRPARRAAPAARRPATRLPRQRHPRRRRRTAAALRRGGARGTRPDDLPALGRWCAPRCRRACARPEALLPRRRRTLRDRRAGPLPHGHQRDGGLPRTVVGRARPRPSVPGGRAGPSPVARVLPSPAHGCLRMRPLPRGRARWRRRPAARLGS
mmetsp:Transcript_23855/g.59131  ORF Transcript_23855/g.59131 Transcript_23855/m.59131 type:complete len:216 (-) Transcript_23855:564-1211(-)